MDALFVSPLETSVSKLIEEHLRTLMSRFETFSTFTAKVVEAERWKVKQFPRSVEVCSAWTEAIVKEASSIAEFYDQDFSKDLHDQHAKLAAQIKAAQLRLQRATTALVPLIEHLSKHSRALLHCLKHRATCESDPWIHEISLRHGAALFLQEKEAFLSTLQELFNQTRLCDAEVEQQMERLRFAFFHRIRQSQRIIAAQTDAVIGVEMDVADLHSGSYNSPQPGFQMLTESSQWQQILENHSLSHEWSLQLAPLDGFLSSLFNFLKSACEDDNQTHTQINPVDRLPRLISDSSLRSGFLMRPLKGLISRSWNACYVVLQRDTRFLHIYKPNFSAQVGVGHVHLPQPGNTYDKQTIADLNALAEQFLHAPHHPGGIDALLCTPHTSIRLTTDCSIGSDPVSGAFSIKTAQEKITLRAFCEEDMVDWVISLKEALKEHKSVKEAARTINTEPEAQEEEGYAFNEPLTEPEPFDSFTLPEPEQSLYADIEDPWSK